MRLHKFNRNEAAILSSTWFNVYSASGLLWGDAQCDKTPAFRGPDWREETSDGIPGEPSASAEQVVTTDSAECASQESVTTAHAVGSPLVIAH